MRQTDSLWGRFPGGFRWAIPPRITLARLLIVLYLSESENVISGF